MLESQLPTITSKDSHLARVLVISARHERANGVVEQRDDVNDDVLNDLRFENLSEDRATVWKTFLEYSQVQEKMEERRLRTFLLSHAFLHGIVVDDVERAGAVRLVDQLQNESFYSFVNLFLRFFVLERQRPTKNQKESHLSRREALLHAREGEGEAERELLRDLKRSIFFSYKFFESLK